MKIHRFITPITLEKDVTLTDKELVHQMNRVLRFEVGETIALCDGNGQEAHYSIVTIDKQGVILTQTSEPIACPTPAVAVTLFAAILKKENFELLVQKATEIGVASIIPVITERTVKQGLNMERVYKIAKEASELCGRGTIPTITEPFAFTDVLAQQSDFDDAWILHMKGIERPPATVATRAILVGPEGGFTETELTEAENAGWKTVSLSPLTFRGETGGIIGSYVATQ
jgi:16S rRNA (uracil1498-N3)-methyltransferase